MSEPHISIQAYICPVCHDDHSWGPHKFTDAELAQHDAELRQQVAREIRAEARAHLDEEIPLGNSMRTCALGDAYVNAARIAEGPTMDRVESR